MTWVPIAFVTAAVFSAVSTPMVSRLALAFGVVDRPSERKVNKRGNIPLLGGVAVAMGLFAGLSAVLFLHPSPSEVAPRVEGLLTGGLLVLALGIVDDRWGLGAWPKLIVQIAAAAIAIHMGYRIDHVSNPVTHEILEFPVWLSWVVTTGWIVIVTNSVNLIDGLDGLCTGVGAIIATTLTIIAWQGGHVPGIALGVVLVGALLGFLPYNFPPARMFLGDTGALFIGYSLSILALEGYGRVTLLTFLVPLLALAVPLLDTGLSIVRRLRHRSHIMQADKMHLHHRLLDEHSGSQRQAVLSIYFLTGCFCLIAVSFTRLEGYAVIVFLAVILLLTLRIVRNLGVMGGENPDDGHSVDTAGEAR
ncbi:MAG: undecaprenyl/decaprenyl-phosphate alpha-N-acetylglucosaminyl 1-phosphate transferase [bacterium]|nr:undecaprenyl/decaprenyl-phosphate alpha-N-acetylglucosaminyl 1-phosphate transferase [bacterium]